MVYRSRRYVNADGRGYRGRVPEQPESRDDLGALLHRLLRRVLAAETPLLAAQAVEMWDYSVLVALESGPAQTQARLAVAIGRGQGPAGGGLGAGKARGGPGPGPGGGGGGWCPAGPTRPTGATGS